jgi:Glycosyltransferase family 9 (heptosyltransferase)
VTRTPGRTLIAPVSFGLGDLVVSLPVVRSLVEDGAGTGRETWLVTRSDLQVALSERIDGLSGTVGEGEVVVGPGDALIDLRDHPLQRDAWWGSVEFEAAHGPLSINEILGRIAEDFGVRADFSSPVALTAHERADVDGLVLFVAASDGTTKRWPPERWVELADALDGQGIEAAIVTRSPCTGDAADRGLREVVAASIGEAVDVLTACRAVVGVDTGLTHIAAQQGTPTVTLARMPAVYFRAWDHTRLAAGDRCDPACRRREEEYAYHRRVDLTGTPPAPRVCPADVSCLRSITPELVSSTLVELL